MALSPFFILSEQRPLFSSQLGNCFLQGALSDSPRESWLGVSPANSTDNLRVSATAVITLQWFSDKTTPGSVLSPRFRGLTPHSVCVSGTGLGPVPGVFNKYPRCFGCSCSLGCIQRHRPISTVFMFLSTELPRELSPGWPLFRAPSTSHSHPPHIVRVRVWACVCLPVRA